MTTFEIIIIVLLAAIVVLRIVLVRTTIKGFRGVWQKLDTNCEISSDIRGDTVDIFQKLNDIEDNILDDLRDMNSQSICWSELTDDQKSEILYRLTHPVVESPFKPPFNPTCETTNKED